MPTLNQRIREFYDASSSLWENVWGEHMHHGYYYPGENSRNKDRRQAQIDLIKALIIWADLKSPANILDAGCGIGGSSIFLAQQFDAKVTGITLSPVQAQRGGERAKEFGVEGQVSFEVVDAIAMPFADHQFDLVWSLESGEHMADKQKFLQECYRVLQPGGTLIFATWCHRPTDAKALTAQEQRHLQRIYDVYCLPYVISLPEYEAIAKNIGFQNIKTIDWSEAVAPFWDVVIDSALTPEAVFGVLRSGLSTINATLSLRQMSRGYADGLVKFGVLVATK
jgi:tocopherol O-methyltransferase